MAFRKKKPKRLYIPTQKKWHARKRPKVKMKRHSTSKLFWTAFRSGTKHLMQDYVYYVAVGIAFAVMILFIIFSSYFSITSIEVIRKNFSVNSAAIENDLNKYIGKNILLFPGYRIRNFVENNYLEFASIEVKKSFPNRLEIHLESHPTIANLKAYYALPEAEISVQEFDALNQAIAEIEGREAIDLAELEEASPLEDEEVTTAAFDLDGVVEEEEEEEEVEWIEQKSLLNRVGQAIFDQEENLELMTITVRNLTQPVEDRERVELREHMDYMLEAIQYFTNVMALEIETIEYLPVAREIHLTTKNKVVFWVNLVRDYKTQIDKLASIYEAAELNKEDISYIDLRVKEKVIYCPRYASCNR